MDWLGSILDFLTAPKRLRTLQAEHEALALMFADLEREQATTLEQLNKAERHAAAVEALLAQRDEIPAFSLTASTHAPTLWRTGSF